ncbi:uncharacterized protein LOC130818544 isoform X2 [Amaranthus tricolor]|uniref:uncharacterized protein LOC130818544 isoform X2 n=1 Tax=Amaranthus tricolor TaxID=29722 RepID=UPI0025901763|nr:uncharacterized protein LOC130818544 isoform X2 [Amaranthus tricolor]
MTSNQWLMLLVWLQERGDAVTFMSDGQKGLLEAFHNVVPQAEISIISITKSMRSRQFWLTHTLTWPPFQHVIGLDMTSQRDVSPECF